MDPGTDTATLRCRHSFLFCKEIPAHEMLRAATEEDHKTHTNTDSEESQCRNGYLCSFSGHLGGSFIMQTVSQEVHRRFGAKSALLYSVYLTMVSSSKEEISPFIVAAAPGVTGCKGETKEFGRAGLSWFRFANGALSAGMAVPLSLGWLGGSPPMAGTLLGTPAMDNISKWLRLEICCGFEWLAKMRGVPQLPF